MLVLNKPNNSANRADESGAALILALFMVFMLTGTVFTIVDMVIGDIQAVLRYRDNIQSRQNALAGLDAARVVLLLDLEEDTRGGGRNADYVIDPSGIVEQVLAGDLAEVWSLFEVGAPPCEMGEIDEIGASIVDSALPMPSGNGAIQFEIREQGRRYPLHRLKRERIPENDEDYKAFLNLLDGIGLEASQARVFTDSLIDWMDANDEPQPYGAESLQYDSLTPSYRSRNNFLYAPDEIKAVYGIDDDILGVVLPFVTNFPHDKRLFGKYTINVNTAPPEVLMGIHESVTYEIAQQISEERCQGPFRSKTEFTNLMRNIINNKDVLSKISTSTLVSVNSDVFRVKSYGYSGPRAHEYVLDTVLQPYQEKGKEKSAILYQLNGQLSE